MLAELLKVEYQLHELPELPELPDADSTRERRGLGRLVQISHTPSGRG